MTKALFKRSGGYFIGLFFSKTVNMALFIILARFLAPSIFGSVIYYLTILSLVTLIADFGTIQWYQKEKTLLNTTKGVVSRLLNARFISLLLSALLLIIYLALSQRFSLFVSSLLIISLIPEALLSIFDGYYLEKKNPKKISIKQIARSIMFAIFLLIFINQMSIEIFAIAVFTAAFINMLWFVPWKYIKEFKLNISEGIKTLKSSAKYAVLITTSYAYSRGDSIIIENTIGSASLGIYSAGYRYLEGLSLLPTALAQNLFHIAAKKDNLKLSQVFKISSVMLVLGTLIGGLLFVSAEFLTTILLGVDYSLAANVVRIFSLVVILFFVNAPLGSIVQSSDILKKFIPWGIGNTILNIILNLIFIPSHGILAAAWIMLFTEVSGLIINMVFVKKIYK